LPSATTGTRKSYIATRAEGWATRPLTIWSLPRSSRHSAGAADGLADQVAADVSAQAARGRIAAALALLSSAERGVLLLIAWGDLSYDEAALVSASTAAICERVDVRARPGRGDRPGTGRSLAMAAQLSGHQHRRTAVPGHAGAARHRLGWRLAVTGSLAVALAGQATLTPGPSEFIYIKSVESAAAMTGDSSGRITSVRINRALCENWLSAGGGRNGLQRERTLSTRGRPTGPWRSIVLQGCRHGRPNPAAGAAKTTSPCVPQRADAVGLPTTAQAMLAYLYLRSHGQNPPPVEAFITAGDLIRQSYVHPAALGALFAAVAQIPGVSVADHALNAVGQDGVAVQQTFRGNQRAADLKSANLRLHRRAAGRSEHLIRPESRHRP
jgi:hypothetical protein